MKIAYILPSLLNSGPIVVAQDLVRMFTQNGHRVEVFYFDDRVELEMPCPCRRISLRDKVDFGAYDVVHAHGFRPQLYVTLHRPLRCRARFVTTLHNYVFNDFHYKYGPRKGVFYAWLHLATCLRFDVLVALSHDARRYYRRFFPLKRVEVAYNTTCRDASLDLSDEERRQVEAFRGFSPLLGTCCGLNPRKRVEVVIQALPLLPGVKFLVVGDGAERQRLEATAARLGVAERVLFVGRKLRGYRYMKYLDAFTLTSTSEGFPLSLLEAASFGTPAITTDLPMYHELFGGGEIETLRSIRPEDVAASVRRVLEHRQECSEAIRRKFGEAYAPERFYARYEEIYKSLD